MRIRTACALLVLVGCRAIAAEGSAAEGEAAVEALGRLNGIALQCRHFGEAKRIKQAMIAWAPKTVGYGTAFETATNDGFMAAAGSDAPCPPIEAMSLRVDQAVEALRSQFLREPR